MAWEWSHAQEAYSAAYENTHRLTKDELLVVLREWAHYDRDKANTLRTRPGAKRPAGFRLRSGLRDLAKDTLADLVWDRAEAHRTCDNGGWNAYVCPYGCHTVSFDGEEGDQ